MYNYFIAPEPNPMIYNPMNQGLPTDTTTQPTTTLPKTCGCGCGGNAGGYTHSQEEMPTSYNSDLPTFLQIGEWLFLAILVFIAIALLKFILG